MTAAPPIPCTWDGESFAPLPRFGQLADKHFVVGEIYPLVVQEARSRESHAHYFAAIDDAWNNLPESTAALFPSSEHLRKFALIKAGYADARSVVCHSQVEAHRLAIFTKPIDPYAVVTVSDLVVTLYTAKSQSLKAMGRKTFQESKTAVLDVVAAMVGVGADELQAEAGKAA